MKLIDMKIPKSKKSDMAGTVMAEPSREEYPYGLRITLDEDQIKKLEHVMDYKPDDEVEISAMAKVLLVKSEDLAGGAKSRRVELQITSICCECEEGYSDDDTPTEKRISMSQRRKGK